MFASEEHSVLLACVFVMLNLLSGESVALGCLVESQWTSGGTEGALVGVRNITCTVLLVLKQQAFSKKWDI